MSRSSAYRRRREVPIRGIAAEVDFEHEQAGLDRPSVISCDGLHTITKGSLATYSGTVSEETMEGCARPSATPSAAEGRP